MRALLFTITRTDGVVLRVTDASTPKIDEFGQTFAPTYGVSSSAVRSESDAQGNNVAVIGVLSSSLITEADVLKGLYRGAEVEVREVDLRFPWQGHFRMYRFWMRDYSWDRAIFDIQCEGIASVLNEEFGEENSRICKHKLGGAFGDGTKAGCKVDLGAYAYTNTVTSTSLSEPNRRFYMNTYPSFFGTQDRWKQYVFGNFTFIDGLNAGVTVQLANYTYVPTEPTEHRLEFFVDLPFPISQGDQFRATPGCNKLPGITPDINNTIVGHCSTVYDQLINFGGDPYTPGTDFMLRAPA